MASQRTLLGERVSLLPALPLPAGGRLGWSSHSAAALHGSVATHPPSSYHARPLSADVPEWVPAGWKGSWPSSAPAAPSFSSHGYGAGADMYEYADDVFEGHSVPGHHHQAHYPLMGSAPTAPPREVSRPRVFVTAGGQEIEFLDTAVNVPRRH